MHGWEVCGDVHFGVAEIWVIGLARVGQAKDEVGDCERTHASVVGSSQAARPCTGDGVGEREDMRNETES